jgi:alkylglycerol monooxygenase
MNKLAFLIPVFLLLALTEWWLIRKSRPGQFSKENTVLNICIGAIDRISSLASFSLFIFVLKLTYDNFRLWTPEVTWYHWVLAYFAVDFVSYWYHRCSHRIAILWCGHVTHHSSDHYNLTNGFRTSPFQGLYRIPFWIILPVLGFSPTVLLVTFVVSGLYDFFLHTQNFPKIRWLELVLITPSLHKVHHGKNDSYIDKNYGATFVIWDRMFGTFQDETEPVSYGILSEDYRDGDPVDAIFHHFKYLWTLMRSASWKNRLKLLVMPPDWIPEEVKLADPPAITFPVPTREQQFYAIVQLIVSAIGIITILVCEERFSRFHFILYAALFLAGMISGTRIFNRRARPHFRRNELVRNLLLAVLFAVALLVPEQHTTDLFYGLVLAIGYAAWSWKLLLSGQKALQQKSVS